MNLFINIAYHQFVYAFAPENLLATLATIALLVFLEISLSGDNALVLAQMAAHLPKNDPKHGDRRKQALYYGMLGAFTMRGLSLIGAGLLLNHLGLVKVVGGIYLLSLAAKSLGGESEGDTPEAKQLGFWPTVARIEVLDMTFSVDNIAACVAITPNIGLVLLGVFIGIVAMRLVSQAFLNMLEKYPTLGKVAYLLIASVAIQMLVSVVFNRQLSTLWQFLLVLSFIIGGIVYDVAIGDSVKQKLSVPFAKIGAVLAAFGDFTDKYVWHYVGVIFSWLFFPIRWLIMRVYHTSFGARFAAHFNASPARP